MGKFSECFSCSCFSPANAGPSLSTSPPPSQQPPNAGTPTSPSPSQQPSNAGRSTSPSSSASPSQLTQQPANPGTSTSPSSSQLPQQPSISGPSTSTTKPFVFDMEPSELDGLIKYIEDELKKSYKGEKCKEGCSSLLSSHIQNGQRFLEFADKHIGKLHGEMKSKDGFSAETPKILTDLLRGAGKIHWVGAAFSVLGFVLNNINEMSRNKKKCLEILRNMVYLAKQLIGLIEEIPKHKEKLEEAAECILEGCRMCNAQLSTGKFWRFLDSSGNADTLNGINDKIDRLYQEIVIMVVRDIHEIVPKIAAQPQEFYAQQWAVGIQSAQDDVIKLLDLSAQHNSARVVVVHGLGGIGKTTLADAVYASIDLQNYNYCRIHMEQNCDIKVLQVQILNRLFSKNVIVDNCDDGRGMIRLFSKENPNQPLFLYIDNGLKSRDLRKLLPDYLGDWLPLKSRILVTTRNLKETNLLVSMNVQRHAYAVIPLPDREGREILLKSVPDYNDGTYINRLLQLCGGMPFLLELAGSQLALNSKSTKSIELETLEEGKEVEDLSDRMVDFVYHGFLQPVQEAFMIITTLEDIWSSQDRDLSDPNTELAKLIVGEEEFKELEEASFIKEHESGALIIHHIVKARAKWMSEGHIIISNRESLSNCLGDKEKLKKVKVINIEETSEQPTIEIEESDLNCMSDSLRILHSSGIKWERKCRKPFKILRGLRLPKDISELPMEFEELEHLAYYCGPLTKDMSLDKLPPTLHWMKITNIISGENGVAYSRIPPPPNVTTTSLLVRLVFWEIEGMEMLPNRVEKPKMLKKLVIQDWPKMKELPEELPSEIGDLSNLETIHLVDCSGLKEWPSSLGDLSLKTLWLRGCSSYLKESLPSHIRENYTIIW